MPSQLEETMALHIRAAKLPAVVREYRFNPPRQWRFDFAWPDLKIAVECEGGTWIKGRHNRPQGFENDCHKYNAAAMLGWMVLRFTKDMIDSGNALNITEGAICHAVED